MDKSPAGPAPHTSHFSRNLLRGLQFTLTALSIGSRAVPFGDNRQLVRDLAIRAAQLYGSDPMPR